jgi:Trypsin
MRRLRSLCFLLPTLALLAAPGCNVEADGQVAPHPSPSAPLASSTAAILGTQRPATIYPEAVTVRVNNSFADFCTGVIVAPRVVLTAAHCMVFNPNSTWTIVAPFAGGQSQPLRVSPAATSTPGTICEISVFCTSTCHLKTSPLRS